MRSVAPPESTPASALPRALAVALQRTGTKPARRLLTVNVQTQSMEEWERDDKATPRGRVLPYYRRVRRFTISTSRFGIGQVRDTNRTPLGLHRIARKIGAGDPVGTVYKGRRPVGRIQEGMPDGGICHRILWLDGLQPGFNKGGDVDTFSRYIYIHGYAHEETLGAPASKGCIHVGVADLIPLFDRTPTGTLVWIHER